MTTIWTIRSSHDHAQQLYLCVFTAEFEHVLLAGLLCKLFFAWVNPQLLGQQSRKAGHHSFVLFNLFEMETITKFNILTETIGFPTDCKYHKSMYRQQNFPFSFIRIQKKNQVNFNFKGF